MREQEIVLYKARDVAPRLGCTTSRVYQLIEAGIVPSVRLGERSIRIPKTAFENWLAALDRDALASVQGGKP